MAINTVRTLRTIILVLTVFSLGMMLYITMVCSNIRATCNRIWAEANQAQVEDKDLCNTDHVVTNRWGYAIVLFTPKNNGELGRVVVQPLGGKAFTLRPMYFRLEVAGEPNDKYDWFIWRDRYESVRQELSATQPAK